MEEWYYTFDGVFFISLGTLFFGAISLSIKYCLKSKCDRVDCCWLHIHRNTEDEIKIEEQELHNINNLENIDNRINNI